MKIAIVSGASSGIGRELVKIIDKHCPMIDEIWVIARRKERLEQLQFKTGHPLRILAMDLSKEESLIRLKKLMDQKKPHIYVLAASAGFGKYGQNISQTFQDATGMIDVNVRALTGLTQMSLPYMVKADASFYYPAARHLCPAGIFHLCSHKSLCFKLRQEPSARK